MTDPATETFDPKTGEIIPNDPFAMRNFSAVLAAAEDGALNGDASNALESIVAELNNAMLDGRKTKAGISVELTFIADRGLIEVSGSIKVKMPTRPRGRSLLYITGGKYLSRRDARQPDLPLRTVDEPRRYSNAE